MHAWQVTSGCAEEAGVIRRVAARGGCRENGHAAGDPGEGSSLGDAADGAADWAESDDDEFEDESMDEFSEPAEHAREAQPQYLVCSDESDSDAPSCQMDGVASSSSEDELDPGVFRCPDESDDDRG